MDSCGPGFQKAENGNGNDVCFVWKEEDCHVSQEYSPAHFACQPRPGVF